MADFGASKQEKNRALRTMCGTQGYLAPEILGLLPRRLRIGREFTNALDLWSLGCLVHELLTSQIPFLEIDHDDDFDGLSDLTKSDFTPQIDMELFYEYCYGTVDFPAEILQNSGASENGVVIPTLRSCSWITAPMSTSKQTMEEVGQH